MRSQVPWNRAPERVIAPYMGRAASEYCCFDESGTLGVVPQLGGRFHLKLNTGARPIANKYCEGKMQRTLKRELKVLEIVKREAIDSSDCAAIIHAGRLLLRPSWELHLAVAPGGRTLWPSRGTLLRCVSASAGAARECLAEGTGPFGVWVISAWRRCCHPAEAPYLVKACASGWVLG